MQDTKPAALPKEIEDLIAIAECGKDYARVVVCTAYRLGRMDGILAFAKSDLKPVATETAVAA